MSQPVSRFLHPFDIAKHPSLEPEVKRAILASWASDRVAVENQPSLRKPPGFDKPVRLDDVLAAMRTLDQKGRSGRSEEHTSELQSLMRISYAVFCLTKKKKTKPNPPLCNTQK